MEGYDGAKSAPRESDLIDFQSGGGDMEGVSAEVYVLEDQVGS